MEKEASDKINWIRENEENIRNLKEKQAVYYDDVNILKEADNIINHRSQEKERQYGVIDDNIDDMVTMFNVMTKSELTIEDGYLLLICNKLAREGFTHKEDNLLDAAAYIGALNNYHQKINKQ